MKKLVLSLSLLVVFACKKAIDKKETTQLSDFKEVK